MREYLFRGKRKDNGKWVTGNLVSTSPDEVFILIGVTGHIKRDDYECYMAEVVPETVGQFTGLKDKNGKEIYEGDILKSFSSSVPSYEVFYYKSSYRLRYKLRSGDFYNWGPLYRMEEISKEGHLRMHPEVIGNIHDNTELVNPAVQDSVTHTMKDAATFDPGTQAAIPANQEAIQEQSEAAQESASQDQAMESTQDSEEGGAEG